MEFELPNLTPEYLPRLELLCLENNTDIQQDHLGGGQDFIVCSFSLRYLITVLRMLILFLQGPIFRVTHSLLPSFKNLKVLILRADEYPGEIDRTYYEDFKTAAEWAKLCPSLLYVVLPFCKPCLTLPFVD